MNVQNMLLMFHMHGLVCSWIVQLVLRTALMLEYLCDNIGLVLVYLPSGSTDVTIHHLAGITPAIRDPYLVSCTFYACWRSLYSPLLKFEEFLYTLFMTTLTMIVYSLKSAQCKFHLDWLLWE